MKKITLDNSQTLHNLARAFAASSQSAVRYELLAQKAKEDDKKKLMCLFTHTMQPRSCPRKTIV